MKKQSPWRVQSRAVIESAETELLELNPSPTDNELRRFISSKYPFGERRRHPYRIWRSEVSVYFLERAGVCPAAKGCSERKRKQIVIPEGQMTLF